MKALVTAALCYGLLSLAPQTASASDVPVSASHGARVPDTNAARVSADLIARAERAIDAYVTACAKREAQALIDVTTADVRLEYALEEPGTFFSIDASSINAGCGSLFYGEARLTNWWILPTNETSSVFVQYDTAEGPQLALVEMRGERIARIVSYSGMPTERLTRSN
jgi:hypothetical protein